MKAIDLMQELFQLAAQGPLTGGCDTCKAGDPTREISRVAVSMFPTVDIIREAAAWGADLLIVHEPMYFDHDHADPNATDPVEIEKRKLVESTGMTVFRFHDHPHYMEADQISDGFWQALDLPGEYHWGVQPVLATLQLDQPITPRALARRIEERLGVAHVRICGAADVPCTRLCAALGDRGRGTLQSELKKPENEIVIAGEICEWANAEYARDAAVLGHKKALLVLGHIGSERDGVELLSRYIAGQHPELTVKYFDCGEVYTYTDRA